MERDLLSIIDDSGDGKYPRSGRVMDGGAAADGDPIGVPLDSKSADGDASRLLLTPLSRHPRNTSAPIKAVSTSSGRLPGAVLVGTPAPPDERVAMPAGALLDLQGASSSSSSGGSSAATTPAPSGIVASGFSTGGGKTMSVSRASMAAAASMFDDTTSSSSGSSNGGKSPQGESGSSGKTGAMGSDGAAARACQDADAECDDFDDDYVDGGYEQEASKSEKV